MLGHYHVGGTEAVRGRHWVATSWGCAFISFLLANPGVPAQGYVPLGGMGMGWVVDTRGFTPVLPYI